MWREHDRFPVSTLDPAGSAPADAVVAVRPFGLQFVAYSPGRPRFKRPEVMLCPQRQVGLVDGMPASEVMPMAATMTCTSPTAKTSSRSTG
jgi:putative ATP-grasp target RiPP